jgi:hypothetical protein
MTKICGWCPKPAAYLIVWSETGDRTSLMCGRCFDESVMDAVEEYREEV